ncbi:signal recognition particle receptor beta subunit-domain-containing protein [Pyronema domesticum]|nr:signal recognition particle receptor beta subunit-domain-containing protein [Pyronema domesticum]
MASLPAFPTDARELLMMILNPSPLVAITIALCIFTIPIFLHLFIFPSSSSSMLPTFLLLGPSSSGKTTITTSFASSPSETRTSQAALCLECDIPASLTKSSGFRSSNDPSMRGVAKFYLQDTPGHGKLRNKAIEMINKDTRGVVFVVDSGVQEEWTDAAEYLHDVLLKIQKLQDTQGNKREEFNVLVACNKSDLFTAKPAQGKEGIKQTLEREIAVVSATRRRGIVGAGEEESDEDQCLATDEDGKFKFESLQEFGIQVVFKSGSTIGNGWRQSMGEWLGESL